MSLTTLIPVRWKLYAVAACVLLTFTLGYRAGAFIVHSQWDTQQLEDAKAKLKLTELNSRTILKLERERNETLAEISNYWADHPLDGVRLPKAPRCPNPNPSRSLPTPAGKGSLPEDVARSGGTDERGIAESNALTQDAYERAVQYAMDSLVAAGKRLTLEADVVVENCRVSAEYLKSLAR